MNTKITSAEAVSSVDLDYLPNGEYAGIWGGYVVEACIDGISYRFQAENGVRGMNCPCVVTVQDGEVTVKG